MIVNFPPKPAKQIEHCDACGRSMTSSDGTTMYGMYFIANPTQLNQAAWIEIYPEIPPELTAKICWVCWLGACGIPIPSPAPLSMPPAPARFTDAELVDLRSQHGPDSVDNEHPSEIVCIGCLRPWPCESIRLLDEVIQSRERGNG